MTGPREPGGSEALGPSTPARDRAIGLLLAGWLEASAGNLDRAEADLDSALALADDLGDAVLRADTQRHRAFLRIQQVGRRTCSRAPPPAWRRTDAWHCRGDRRRPGPGRLRLADDRRHRARDPERHRGHAAPAPLGDSWGLVHAGALLGGIAQAEHRFEDAVDALARAAHESQRLGFLGQAALHLASLARVQQRAGAVEEAAASFDRALAAARASGDGRLASTARLNLARLRRAAGDHRAALDLLEENERWYDAAGGGTARC